VIFVKRRVSGILLSLLLLLTLTACGQSQGADSVSFDNSSSSGLTDLPVQEPEDSSQPEENLPDGSQDVPDESQNSPDDNQAPSNEDGNAVPDNGNQPDGKSDEGNRTLDEDGWYSSKEDVALYIHLYGDLPDNYVSKDEAEDAGWHGGNVERYTGEGTAIGGSRFGNREGLLPKAPGRTYTECDIDTVGENSRGAKRVVFSNDGLVYYTDDHYESFELLYGEP